MKSGKSRQREGLLSRAAEPLHTATLLICRALQRPAFPKRSLLNFRGESRALAATCSLFFFFQRAMLSSFCHEFFAFVGRVLSNELFGKFKDCSKVVIVSEIRKLARNMLIRYLLIMIRRIRKRNRILVRKEF